MARPPALDPLRQTQLRPLQDHRDRERAQDPALDPPLNPTQRLASDREAARVVGSDGPPPSSAPPSAAPPSAAPPSAAPPSSGPPSPGAGAAEAQDGSAKRLSQDATSAERAGGALRQPPTGIGDATSDSKAEGDAGADPLQRAVDEATLLPAVPLLEATRAGATRSLVDPRAVALPLLCKSFGNYKLIQVLGYGGMGVVYKARQSTPARTVALKMMLDGRSTSRVDLRRFATEAQAVAQLDHPSIVPIYEVGEHEGRGFYTMKLMEAGSLSHHLARFSQNPRAAAELVVKIARAVHHAHCRGILHRDLKPSNILLDSEHLPYVADFGLACRMDTSDELTLSGQLVGTPPYMAPEQICGDRKNVTVATDVYGLGTILYALLTGRPPARGESVLDTLKLIQEQEPAPPRSSNPWVHRDLETICMKALKKKPEQRYGSAAELADDLQRFLDGVPIKARPLGPWQRAWRSARRRPIAAVTLLSSVVIIALSVAGLYVHSTTLERVNHQLADSLRQSHEASLQALAAQQRAEESEAQTERLLYVSDVALAAQAGREGDTRQLRELLERHRPRPGATDHRGFEWHYLWQVGQVDQRTIDSRPGAIYASCYSPSGNSLAVAGRDGMIRVYDTWTYREQLTLASSQIEVNGLCFSPDSQRLASAGDDGTVRVWDLTSGQQTLAIAAHPERVYQVVFVPDSDLLVSCGNDPVIRLWDSQSGKSLGQLEGHEKAVEAIALSGDGRVLASVASDETARLWSLDTASELRSYRGHSGRVTNVAFAPDGDAVATVSLDKTVQVWSTATGQRLFTGTTIDGCQSVAFAPSGLEIVTGDRGGAMTLWRASGKQWSDEAQRVRRWQAHRGRVYDVTFSLSGNRIVSAGEDGVITLWKRPPTLSLDGIMPEDTQLGMTAVALRGWLAIARQDHIELWDVVNEYSTAHIDTPGPSGIVAATADGRLLAASDRRGRVQMWDLEDRYDQPAWDVRLPSDSTYPLTFSPDGRLLAVSSHNDSQLWIFETASGREHWELAVLHCHAPSFSPCSRYLAVPTQNDVLIWDLQNKQYLRSLLGHRSSVTAAAFSPDGRSIASASHDRLVKIWDVATGAELFSMAGHRTEVDAVAFAPDGRSLISADRDGLVRIWHVGTGRPLLQIDDGSSPIARLLTLPGGCELFELITERQTARTKVAGD